MNDTVELNEAPRRSVSVSDLTGSRRWDVDLSPDCETVGEFLTSFVDRSQLPTRDSGGRPTTYTLRSERTGARLHPSAPISDLEEGERLTLSPSTQAGGLRVRICRGWIFQPRRPMLLERCQAAESFALTPV